MLFNGNMLCYILKFLKNLKETKMFKAAADYLILEKTEFHKALERMLDEARSLGANG